MARNSISRKICTGHQRLLHKVYSFAYHLKNESEDPTRLEQFKAAAHNGKLTDIFSALRTQPLNFENIVEYNIERGRLINLREFQNLDTGDMISPLQKLDDFLTNTKSLVLIDYVVTQTHADTLSDYLIAWSQDNVLHNNQSTVLVFTSNVNLFNETLRRLSYTIEIVPSSFAERKDLGEPIVAELVKAWKTKHGTTLKLKVTDEVLQASNGLTLHQFKTALIHAAAIDHDIVPRRFTEAKTNLLKTIGLQYIEPAIDFSFVGGYELLKQYIRNRICLPLKSPDKAAHYGISSPKGIVLFGYPGCGKSLLAEAIAKEVGLPMVAFGAQDIMRGIVGEAEARTKQIINTAENLAPIVLNIEEIDSLLPARSRVSMTDSGVGRRLTNQMLEWLGRRKRRSFIVGSTNFLQDMDPAGLRPGRIDEIILVLPPDLEARLQILQIHCSKVRKLPLGDINFEELGKKTFGWTGAELEKMCIGAAHVAMEEDKGTVTMDHFHKAMKDIEINITERKNTIRTMIQQMKATEGSVSQSFLQEQLQKFEQQEGDKDRVRGLIENL